MKVSEGEVKKEEEGNGDDYNDYSSGHDDDNEAEAEEEGEGNH